MQWWRSVKFWQNNFKFSSKNIFFQWIYKRQCSGHHAISKGKIKSSSIWTHRLQTLPKFLNFPTIWLTSDTEKMTTTQAPSFKLMANLLNNLPYHLLWSLITAKERVTGRIQKVLKQVKNVCRRFFNWPCYFAELSREFFSSLYTVFDVLCQNSFMLFTDCWCLRGWSVFSISENSKSNESSHSKATMLINELTTALYRNSHRHRDIIFCL